LKDVVGNCFTVAPLSKFLELNEEKTTMCSKLLWRGFAPEIQGKSKWLKRYVSSRSSKWESVTIKDERSTLWSSKSWQ